jgi:target of rapamycin complex 2 subunit MAPKAP1
MPQSPDISDDEGAAGPSGGRRVRTGLPGHAGLKYTETIMGPSRMGGMGMRVSGRRIPPDKEVARRSISATSSTPRRTRAGSEPTPNSSSPVQGASPRSQDNPDGSLIHVSKRRSAGGSSLSEIPTTLFEQPAEAEKEKEDTLMIPNAPMALQSSSMIAAMQARRQRRRAHFSSAGGNATRPIIISEPKLNLDVSSSDEESGIMSGSLADDDFMVEVEGSLEVENEFDPYAILFLPPVLYDLTCVTPVTLHPHGLG